MIIGLHAILFTDDAEATRAFLRDTLGLESVDAGGGWLTFAGPPAELAAHPAEGTPHHEVYLMCDDIHATVSELAARGVQFTDGVVEQAWGLRTALKLPGGGQIPLYQPSHAGPLIT
jgi:catechol 2,3-dioxygenase-like lactoylglutathione lyase family enzyme